MRHLRRVRLYTEYDITSRLRRHGVSVWRFPRKRILRPYSVYEGLNAKSLSARARAVIRLYLHFTWGSLHMTCDKNSVTQGE